VAVTYPEYIIKLLSK